MSEPRTANSKKRASTKNSEGTDPEAGTLRWCDLNEGQRLLRLWFWIAIFSSIVFVLVFPLRWYFPDFLPGVVGRMQLSLENNVGAWWSGILLLMLSLHAYDASVVKRERAPKLARAWAILAAILLFFSADEVGSMHERLSLYGNRLGVGDWGLILPLGGVIGGFLLYALYTMWQDRKEHRRYVLPLLVGFALLGSVAIQEYFEHRIDWGSGPIVWIRMAVEEGTELAGMIVLLYVVLRPSMEKAGLPQPSDRRLFVFLRDHSRRIFVAVGILTPVFALLAVVVADHRGQLANWLAISLFAIAGLAAFSRVMSGETDMRGRLTCIAFLCVLASVTPMWYKPPATIVIGDFETSERVAVLAVICLLICGMWLATVGHQARSALKPFIVVSGVWFLLMPFMVRDEFHVFMLSQLMAVLTLVITYVAIERSAEPGEVAVGVAERRLQATSR